MRSLRVLKNQDIHAALLAAPAGHKHLRLALSTKDGESIVLQEATVAAIVRAYTSVKTHPARRAVKLVSDTPEGLKKGYAHHQLVEADVPDDEVVSEMTGLLGG